MNWAIVKNTWQMCLASKLRQIVLVLLILFPLAKTTAELCITKEFPSDYLSEAAGSVFFVLTCGSGCIGRQLNDGTLSLVLSRPVKISSYAVSKWLSVAIASSLASMIQFAAELIVQDARAPYVMDAGFILTNGVERLLMCAGFSAVLMFFSSLVSGSKDLAVYLVCYIVEQIVSLISQIRPETIQNNLGKIAASIFVPPAGVLAQILQLVLAPSIDLSPLINHVMVNWFEITAYFAVVTFFISICIFSLNRRELPYGAD